MEAPDPSAAADASGSRGFYGSNRHFEYRASIGLVFGLAAAFMPAGDGSWYFVGLGCVLAFAAIRAWTTRFMGGAAHVHERKARKKRTLLTEGPFRFCRNPLYVANSLGIAGTCFMLAPAWFGALGLIASLVWYSGVASWEEGNLAELYPDEYPQFMASTRRLLPIPKRRPQPTDAEPYPWSKVVRRERGVLSGVVLISLLAAWKVGFFG
ncbi:MAG: isoprenylcysteine carboxylmethyltransferase family protein [Planctomycetes bacterium]|nr:isoprenylcysteine carboxylmethyltransferase family protein [Planctomycetota bacterium]